MAVEYTLSPLVKDGRHCLACSDVDGMESAILESVEFYYNGVPWQRIVRQSDDVFMLIEKRIFKWPALHRIVAARFRLRLRGEVRSRRFTVRASSQISVNHEKTSPVILDWVKKRKFIKGSSNAGQSLEQP